MLKYAILIYEQPLPTANFQVRTIRRKKMAYLPFGEKNFMFFDCEFTGLNPETDRILEIAVVVTSPDFRVRVQGPAIAIHQSDRVLNAMDPWNRDTHARTGLTRRVRASEIDETQAERMLLDFARKYVPAGKGSLAGNCINIDRQFLARNMVRFNEYFRYGTTDVVTLIELAKRLNPRLKDGFKRKNAHGAAADANEAVDMFIHYTRSFRW